MGSVTLEHISKTFPGGVEAVRDVSLEIADGEFVVLVGPSGCGKTTVLRLVAGLESLTSGTVAIDGRPVDRLAPKDRDIAMVFQNYALYPHMSVFKNMSFGLRMRKVPRVEIEARVERAAELLDITPLLGRRPGELSGGQQQRVALGRAIVREPACFLFDEPLSNLDARLRTQMRGELKALHRRLATTTIYVTHDQEEAMTLGDRVVVMHGGRVQQVGRPLEVYRRPATSFVAGFVGSPPMNLLPGHVRDGVFDDGGGFRRPVPGAPDGEIVLGVRPEAIALGDATGDAAVPVIVEVCEPIGDRMDVQVLTEGGTRLVCRVPATDDLVPEQPVHAIIEPAALHLFEPGAHGARLEAVVTS